MTVLRIQCGNIPADDEVIKAQKQWEANRTVSAKYLERVLGDISKGVSVFAANEPPAKTQAPEPKK